MLAFYYLFFVGETRTPSKFSSSFPLPSSPAPLHTFRRTEHSKISQRPPPPPLHFKQSGEFPILAILGSERVCFIMRSNVVCGGYPRCDSSVALTASATRRACDTSNRCARGLSLWAKPEDHSLNFRPASPSPAPPHRTEHARISHIDLPAPSPPPLLFTSNRAESSPFSQFLEVRGCASS